MENFNFTAPAPAYTAASLVVSEAWVGLASGGFSISIGSMGEAPASGYMVAIPSRFKVNPCAVLPVSHVDTIDKLAAVMSQVLSDAKANFLPSMGAPALHCSHAFMGGWVDNGFVYIEVSFYIESYQAAMIKAIENKEKAIYNLATGECINTHIDFYQEIYTLTDKTYKAETLATAGSEAVISIDHINYPELKKLSDYTENEPASWDDVDLDAAFNPDMYSSYDLELMNQGPEMYFGEGN